MQQNEVSRMSWEDVENPTLRDYAVPSVNYVGYGMGAENFADQDIQNSFWNAHGDPELQTKDQWMMYDLGERQAEITGSSILFYDDGGGVMVPTDIKVEYGTKDGGWAEVTRKGSWTFAGNVEKI